MTGDVTGRFAPCLNPATVSGLPLEQFLALAAGAGFPTHAPRPRPTSRLLTRPSADRNPTKAA
ncbi:hypothetical protein [Streptomyces sp. AC555_RSS877]|uniref:hypothetical protein n=1 Tax=Streptomyces sp. AC555_RSS877 TaxID=2823688 RepID=UPI001C2718A7|nr:hypothetical protein [Streptomyces sp. AC555_RSS877]